MKFHIPIPLFFCILVVSIALPACNNRDTTKIKISRLDKESIALSPAAPPFGPTAIFELECENSAKSPIKASIVFELVYDREHGHTTFDVASFYDIQIAPGSSKIRVHFQTMSTSLKGAGTLHVYLAERLVPGPKTPRIFSSVADSDICILDKPVTEEIANVELAPLSDVLLIPVTAQ